MKEQSIARPPIKWAGGKTLLLSEILSRLPAKIDTYYEPFVGGGAVFFALATEKRFERAVVGDVNTELMNVYATVRDHVGELMVYLDPGPKQDEKTYYEIRSQDPRTLPPLLRATRTIYLNKVGFNGLFRVNRKGVFNVPWGKQEDRSLFDEASLILCSVALQRVTLVSSDFDDAVKPAKRGDAVYFDCPYWPVSKTANFTAYANGGFTSEDQKRLRDCALQLKKRGVHVLLSNSDVPPVRALYAKDFKIERVEAPRRINSKGGGRGNVGELLISGRNI